MKLVIFFGIVFAFVLSLVMAQPPPCVDNKQCPRGYMCVKGDCIPGPTGRYQEKSLHGQHCKESSDCDGPCALCLDGQCVHTPC